MGAIRIYPIKPHEPNFHPQIATKLQQNQQLICVADGEKWVTYDNVK